MVFVPIDEVVVVFVPFEACSSRWKVVEAFEDACEGLIKQTRSRKQGLIQQGLSTRSRKQGLS